MSSPGPWTRSDVCSQNLLSVTELEFTKQLSVSKGKRKNQGCLGPALPEWLPHIMYREHPRPEGLVVADGDHQVCERQFWVLLRQSGRRCFCYVVHFVER